MKPPDEFRHFDQGVIAGHLGRDRFHSCVDLHPLQNLTAFVINAAHRRHLRETYRSQVRQEGMHRAMPGLPWAPHRIAHADGATLTERHALVGTIEWMSGHVVDGSPHKMAEYG